MPDKIRKRIMPQMHDVRPVNASGGLDLEKMRQVGISSKGNIKKDGIGAQVKTKHIARSANRNVLPNTCDVRPFQGISEKKEKAKSFHIDDAPSNGFKKAEAPQQSVRRDPLSHSKTNFCHNNTGDIVFKPAHQESARKTEKTRVYQFGQTYDSDDVPMVCQAGPSITEKEAVSKKEPEVRREPTFASCETVEPLGWTRSDAMLGGDGEEFVLMNNPTAKQDRHIERIAPRIHNTPVFRVDAQRKNPKKPYSSTTKTLLGKIGKIKQARRNFTESFSEVFSLANIRKAKLSFSGAALAILLLVIGTGFFNKGLKIRDSILGTGKEAYVNLALAKDGMISRDFNKSSFEFAEAANKFERISNDINDLGGIIIPASRYIPYLSKLSSGDNMAQAGKNISRMGILAGEIMQTMNEVKNPLNKENSSISFLNIFQSTDKNLREILDLMEDTDAKLSNVNVDDIPENQRVQFVELRSKLPIMKDFIGSFLESDGIMTDVLGGNGPRKYLFLFQNNQEMRATGGFIGTYGILDIFNGRVRNFFMDGIYNPDGQLREKIVPPEPIQKMSASWSLHDSNWFPDFPKSAEKAAWFYEKTGGPTVDGVITMTPNVMQRLLEVTGPIEMSDYGIVVDKDNFVETVQQEVEVDYDKEMNQPKKILADLAPKVLDRIFNAKNPSDMAKTLQILVESLNEKQILIYSKNYDIEKMLSSQGWSGEVLNTQKDYLSVINTNINGYKTDGVIDESISHQAQIHDDGSVIDTVTITRHHNGGSMNKDWWNKVNSNYMRVYVPKGSKLLSAEGQTREFNSPPLDYKKLGFKWDPQVMQEEDSMQIDEANGTRVYEDSEKTVFANWAYVSPQETVVIKYTYLLPFKIDIDMAQNPVDTYSLLVQKQSGSLGSKLLEEINYPQSLQTNWSYPDGAKNEGGKISAQTDLKEDKFFGAAFTKK